MDADVAAVLDSSVGPFLESRGYTASDYTYRSFVEFGTYAIFSFDVMTWVPGQRLMHARFGVVLHKARPWLPRDLQEQVAIDPGIEKAQFSGALLPSGGYASDVPMTGWRLLDGESVDAIGPVLVDRIDTVALPLIAAVLNGERRMAALSHPEVQTSGRAPHFINEPHGEPLYRDW
jgi:hypothetical protein